MTNLIDFYLCRFPVKVVWQLFTTFVKEKIHFLRITKFCTHSEKFCSKIEMHFFCTLTIYLLRGTIFSFPPYYVWGTLVIVQICDFRFLVRLHVLGSRESKKHEISKMSECSLIRMLVC